MILGQLPGSLKLNYKRSNTRYKSYEVTSFSVAICMKQMKILCGQLNCSEKLALRMTRASSRNVGKFYRTVKLSAKNLCLFHEV